MALSCGLVYGFLNISEECYEAYFLIPTYPFHPSLVFCHFCTSLKPTTGASIQNQEVAIPQSSAITVTFSAAVTFDAGRKIAPMAALLTQPLWIVAAK